MVDVAAQLRHERPEASEQSLGDLGGGGDGGGGEGGGGGGEGGGGEGGGGGGGAGGGGEGGGMQTMASILWHSPPSDWHI